eukprot:TRINITY_DN8267_c0_g1_i2.p1 TRINITY_DN8267_c0_g1~~TRINITY_DN8267_c0_g1_i2.p1  ORF type:complete len:500 (+),score=81.14 TRINITY_DN8267_c0_g1_i2:100-1500(+)
MEKENTQNNTNLNNAKCIALEVNVEKPYLVYNQTHQVHVMATIKGMTYETLARNSRASIDLVAVIDRSGSMKERIELVQETIKFMIQQLKSTDQLGIVVYDHEVDILLPLTKMDADGKQNASLALKRLSARGQTNISGGLLQALDMIRTQKNGNEVSSVLLFSDGKANIGIVSTAAIVRAVEGVFNQLNSVCSVFTFGYGEPDPEYLKSVSDVGNGMFYFIDKAEAIPDAFADCLGGLLSVVAQNIVLTIEASKSTKIKQVLTHYRTEIESPGAFVKVYIGDLYSEEQKDIMVLVEVTPIDEPKESDNIVEFNLQYLNVLGKGQHSEFQREWVKATRSKQTPPEIIINKPIDKQKNRLTAAQALESALKAGKDNDYNSARQHLEVAKSRIQSSSTATDEYCSGLVRQLDQCSQDVKDKKEWKKTGEAKLTSMLTSHTQQRATHVVSSYSTKSKSVMRSFFSNKTSE